MNEQRAPRGAEWGDVIDALHAFGNTLTVRSHYGEGHPAIAVADDAASSLFTRVLARIPDLIVALVDGEFIVCERPLPDLRARLHVLADAMLRHDIECVVFQRGVTRVECTRLASALAGPADVAGRVRAETQTHLAHVLLRFVMRLGEDGPAAGTSTAYFVPAVQEVLIGVARALAEDTPVDRWGVLAVCDQIVLACASRTAMIEQRSWTRSIVDEATHATNVATMTAMMALEAGYPREVCIDATAAALLHDIGHLFLPEEIRGIPEPLLDERAKTVFRNHTFAGAAMLLGAGCPALWIAAAFEHHRGVDAGGYPTLESTEPPHELVRIIALANFFDRKRTLLEGRADSPDGALRAAMDLEPRYFGAGLLRRFLKVIGVFPAGTTVELTSLEPAIVTRANPADPWRPEVRILCGPNTGKLVELRDVHALEARHRLSIVRAIAPPLLVLGDAVADAPELAEIAPPARALVRPPAPAPDAGPAARQAQDRARASLAGMDAILDALLTVPTDALVSSMPPAPSGRPGARLMSIPPYAAPPQVASRPPPLPSTPPAGPEEERELLVGLGSVASVPALVADVTSQNVDHRGAFVLRFIDGMSSVEDILDASGLPRIDVLRVLDDLLKRRVIAMR